MKIFKLSLLSLAFLATFASADEKPKNLKFAFDGILLGGIPYSDWVYGSELQSDLYKEANLKLGEQAQVYGFTGIENTQAKLVEVKAFEPKIADAADFLFIQEITVATEGKNIGLGDAKLVLIGGNDAMPRKPKIFSSNADVEKYKKISFDYLKAKNLNLETAQISQVLSVDLDGDSEDEIIINVQNLVPQDSENFSFAMDKSLFLKERVNNPNFPNSKAGDFSQILVISKGKVIELVGFSTLEADISPSIYKVSAIADLNGDGVLEIIVTEANAQDFRYYIYEFKDGEFNKEPSAVG